MEEGIVMAMLLRWSSRWAKAVDDTRVTCELRDGGVSLAECGRCPWLLEFRVHGAHPVVLCRPDAARYVATPRGR